MNEKISTTELASTGTVVESTVSVEPRSNDPRQSVAPRLAPSTVASGVVGMLEGGAFTIIGLRLFMAAQSLVGQLADAFSDGALTKLMLAAVAAAVAFGAAGFATLKGKVWGAALFVALHVIGGLAFVYVATQGSTTSTDCGFFTECTEQTTNPRPLLLGAAFCVAMVGVAVHGIVENRRRANGR